MGRRSTYQDNYPDKVYEYMDTLQLTEIQLLRKLDRKGSEVEIENIVACKMPTVWDLAKVFGCRISTLYEWERRFKEFEIAMQEYRELQKYFLIQNTLRGYYKEGFAIFVMKNITDWTDTPKIKIDARSMDDEDLLKQAKKAIEMLEGSNGSKNKGSNGE